MLTAIALAAAVSCAPLYATPGVAQDDGAIYFTTVILPFGARDDFRTLFRQSKSDGRVSIVTRAPGQIGALDIDGPRLWYGTTTCDIDGCPLEFVSSQLRTVTTTGGAPAVLVDKTPPIRQIVHDATHIYWRELVRTGPTGQLFASRIRRYEKRTGNVETLLDDGELYSSMILTENAIFLMSFYAEVVMLPKSGGSAVTLAQADREDVFFQRAGGIYFRRDHALERLPIDGAGPVVSVANAPPGFIEYGCLGDRYVYSTLELFGVPKLFVRDLCSTTSETLVSYAPAYFALDSCAMYIPFNTPVPWPAERLRIDDVEPSHAARGSMQTVTIAGLDPLVNVTVGGVAAGAIVIDDTTIGVFVPPLPPGAALVTVTNPNGDCASMWTAIDP